MSGMVQAHSFANFMKKRQKTKYNLTKNVKVFFLQYNIDMFFLQNIGDFAKRTATLSSLM